jgi:DNA polymerase-4
MVRKIIHLDLDAFFCSVEERNNPALLGKAFAVGGKPDERGVVASCSYAARQKGIHSAMPMAQAVRLCRDLIIIHSHYQDYSHASREVMNILHNLTPLVEQLSIDEAFLDLTDLPESAEVLAHQIQKQINDQLKLPCSLGVATNKLVAKIANDQGKSARRGSSPPNAITVVSPGQEAAYLAPLPAIALWGVGPKTSLRLAELGMHTIGDIAKRSEAELINLFGKNGGDLAHRARGIDDSPIVTSHETKSISQETTFTKDVRDQEILEATIRELSTGVGKHLRSEHLFGRTVKIKLRWSDFTTLTRQLTLPRQTDQDDEIIAAALTLFQKTWEKRRPVRLIGVGVSGLGSPVQQLNFWEIPSEKKRKLQDVLDKLRARYGEEIVRKGGSK